MLSNPIYDGPQYETISETKPKFDSLPMLPKAQESCYVEITGSQALSSNLESPPTSTATGERSDNEAAATSSSYDEEYTCMRPAKVATF